MTTQLHWYVGPWIWDATGKEKFWRSPSGLACLDTRTLPQQMQAGGSPGIGVFSGLIAPADLESKADYTHIGAGSWYDIKPTGKERAAIPARKNFTPTGDDLVGMLLSIFTMGADPDGSDGPKPIVPTMGGRISLHLSQTHHENFSWGGFHTPILRQQLRNEFGSMWADAQAGKMRDAQHPRRVLDFWCKKYGVDDWKEFVAPALQPSIPGVLPHETMITDNFNRADNASLGSSSEGWSWSSVISTSSIASNKAKSAVGTESEMRADSDLSSADHYSQSIVDISAEGADSNPGLMTRKDSSATDTCYLFVSLFASDLLRIRKKISGVQSLLNTSSFTLVGGTGYTVKGESNGSSQTIYVNGASQMTATDTAITGNLRCGIRSDPTTYCTYDNFQAADLAVSGILYTQLERGVRGLNRGMYQHFGG